MKKAMSRVCSEILVGHLFLSFTFSFYLRADFPICMFYASFSSFLLVAVLSFELFAVLFSRISKPKIVEVGLRVSRRSSKSAEKQKAGRMLRHDDTRHLDYEQIR